MSELPDTLRTSQAAMRRSRRALVFSMGGIILFLGLPAIMDVAQFSFWTFLTGILVVFAAGYGMQWILASLGWEQYKSTELTPQGIRMRVFPNIPVEIPWTAFTHVVLEKPSGFLTANADEFLYLRSPGRQLTLRPAHFDDMHLLAQFIAHHLPREADIEGLDTRNAFSAMLRAEINAQRATVDS